MTLPPDAVIHCPLCGGDTWSNVAEKATGARARTSPDFKCKGCHAVDWIQADGSHRWLPGPPPKVRHTTR